MAKPKPKDDKTQLPTHGAAVLPSVRVDSYNVEVQDEDGFLGDKASKGAFCGDPRQVAQGAEGGRRGPARRQADRRGRARRSSTQMLTRGRAGGGSPGAERGGGVRAAAGAGDPPLPAPEGVARHRMPGDRRRLQRQPPGRAGRRARRPAAQGGRHPGRAGADPQRPRRGRAAGCGAPAAGLDAERIRRHPRGRRRRQQHPRRHRRAQHRQERRTCPRRAWCTSSCGATATRGREARRCRGTARRDAERACSTGPSATSCRWPR